MRDPVTLAVVTAVNTRRQAASSGADQNLLDDVDSGDNSAGSGSEMVALAWWSRRYPRSEPPNLPHHSALSLVNEVARAQRGASITVAAGRRCPKDGNAGDKRAEHPKVRGSSSDCTGPG